MTGRGILVTVSLGAFVVVAAIACAVLLLWPKLIAPWQRYAAALLAGAVTYSAAQVGSLPPDDRFVGEQLAWGAAFMLVCLGVTLERKEAAKIEQLERDKEALSRAGSNRAHLLGMIEEFVASKVERCKDALSRKGENKKQRNKNALSPEPHLREIAIAVGRYWKGRLKYGVAGEFRAAIYIENKGTNRLESLATYSTKDDSTAHPPSVGSDAFLMKSDDPTVRPSLAVRCVRFKRMFVVEDCAAPPDEADFFFFEDDQREYLKSMVAFPIECIHNR